MEHQIPVPVAFVSVEPATHVAMLTNSVVPDRACVELFQLVWECPQDHSVIPQTVSVNVHRQLLLVVEHQTPVLMEFVSVEPATHAVMLEKPVVRDLACAELFQLVLE